MERSGTVTVLRAKVLSSVLGPSESLMEVPQRPDETTRIA